MATPYVTGNEATNLTKMVRDYNVIIQDKGSVSDAKIIDYLNNHAFPRIRGRLITATDSMNKHVFYEDIKELSNPTVAQAADTLVFSVMTQSLVKDYVFRIAAALAASWAINMLVGQLEAQQKIAWQLEKEAMQDLQELVRSPELVAAAQQAKKNIEDQPSDNLPRIYIALDVNPATYNMSTNTVLTYNGAQEAGIARLWLGPYQISVPVAVGDTPNIMMNKLLQALRALQISPVPGMNYNLVLGPNEGMVNLADTRYISYKPNPMSPEVTTLATVAVNLGYLEFHAFQHAPDVDGLFCTLELLKSDGVTLGIKGFVYSTGRAVEYKGMTVEGPHSVFIDLSQGTGQNVTSVKDKLPTDLSDTFYFNIPVGGVLTADGIIKYQIQNLVSAPSPPAVVPKSVEVKAGDSALDIVLKIARDIEKFGAQYKVLSAVRSPTNVAIGGTIAAMPGLRMVPYRPDPINRKIIVDILEVPAEVQFGVVPQAMAGIGGPFDNKPKSLVLECNFAVQGNTVSVSPMTGTKGSARVVEPNVSNRLFGALNDITMVNRGIF